MRMAAYPTKKTSEVARGMDRYELVEELGEGGMGVVWRARDSKTGADVAVKIMKDISDAESLDLFTKEWKTLSDLSHPNIVDVRDVDVLREGDEQKPFFVMPLLRGATLADLIRNSSERLTCSRVVEIFSQVCRGLQAAHNRGLIHRDLKPSNIFVMEDDTAKIIDFGVVHLAGSQSATGQKGTFQYMSPEQIQMKEITPASDIFALGVSLYEALTGRKPFARQTVDETIHAVLKLIPPPVSELNPAIPTAISQVVHKCIAKQPVNRFSSARELADFLGKAFRNEPIFDEARLRDRLDRIRAAIKYDDLPFASELLLEIESEGHISAEMGHLRGQIETVTKKRRIEHLLAGARARIDQDEIPLGLEKLRELLDLDPENSDALALRSRAENQRSEAQAGKWIELANNHLGNCDFAAARHAAQEALNSRAGDVRAVELLRKVDSMEVEAKRIREQKEQLYLSALKDYQKGEIDSALSRLGRLFSVLRSRPEGSVPERDAVYETFYKEVCSEHDLVRSRIDEAQHQLQDENFAQALSICAEQLAKYPNSGTFQALKIQIEDAERQKISAVLATTSKNADAEPDLDRRANIWREASERYPNDAQFAQQLKVACERRDLVNSIVAKAHQLSEKGEYNEELTQWDMLRNIHPRFPGLVFELEQCRRKRDLQVRNEEKAHLVEEIVSLMEARQFARALERCESALVEYPKDTELAGLEKLSREGLQRSSDCDRLLMEGQAEAAAGQRIKAIDRLKEALSLDPRNTAVQDLLITLLIERARTLMESDLFDAQLLYQEARSRNPMHRTVRSFGIEILNAARQKYVGECLTEARGLVAVGDMRKAWERVVEGLNEYPRETRLRQFRDFLLKEYPELQFKVAAPNGPREKAEMRPENPAPGTQPPSAVDRHAAIRESDENETLASLLRAYSSTASADSNPKVDAHYADGEADGGATVLFQATAAAGAPSPAARFAARLRIQRWIATCRQKALVVFRGIDRRYVGPVVYGAAVVLAAAIGLALFVSAHHRPTIAAPDVVAVHLSATPADSVFKSAGVAHAGGDFTVPVNGSLSVEVSHIGYQARTVKVTPAPAHVTIVLDPLPVRITLATSEKDGEVEIDGKPAGVLVDGSIDGIDVPADGATHTLVLVVDRRRTLAVEFQANPGHRPVLMRFKPSPKDMLLVASMGSSATVYGGAELKDAAIGGNPFTFSKSGVDVSLTADPQEELTYNYGGETGSLTLSSSDWPAIALRSIGAPAELLITSNVDTATLTADGKLVQRSARGWRINEPGEHNFVLTAANYKPQSWSTVLKPRQTLREDHRLEGSTAAAPLMSSLTINSGTAGALVELDGASIGSLDSNGAAQFADALPAGRHHVHFHKDQYCSVRDADVVAAPPVGVLIESVKLDACARITVQRGVRQASVKAIHKADENARWIELPTGEPVSLPAGTYQLAIESDGDRSYTTEVHLEAGRSLDFSPQLAPVQHCQLEKPSDVANDGVWIKPRTAGTFVYLSPGCVNISLIFVKPKGNFMGRRRVDWSLELPAGAGRINWEFDGEKISRKSTVQHTFDQREANIQASVPAQANEYVVSIHVEGSRVVITAENGTVLDDYTPTNTILRDLTAARIGIRTSAEFRFTFGGM